MSKHHTHQSLLNNQEKNLLFLNSKKLPVVLLAVLLSMNKVMLGHGEEAI
jgi:hypothetical protein